MSTNSVEPGQYPDMTNEEYQSAPGVSKSQLDLIASSPKHYWQKYLNPHREPEERTPALILGDAIHKAVLEPDLFANRFIARPAGIDGRTNAGKAALAELHAEAAGRTILSQDDYKMVVSIRDAVHLHRVAGPLFRNGTAEESFFARDRRTGELVRCRTDFLKENPTIITDLKTTESASAENFGRSAAKYRYDVQAAWYIDVIESLYGEVIEHFVFVAVEKSPPFAVGVYYILPEDIHTGRILAQRNFDALLKCREEGFWPDFGDSGPEPLKIPTWARRSVA